MNSMINLRRISLILAVVLAAFVLKFLFFENRELEPISESEPAKSGRTCEKLEALCGCGREHGDSMGETAHKKKKDLSEMIQRSAADADQFAQWMAAIQEGDELSSDALLKGVELAKVRKVSMLKLMKDAPEESLALAVSWSEYQTLPEQVRVFVETPFSVRGDFSVFPNCGGLASEEPGHAEDNHGVSVDGVHYQSTAFGRRENITTKENTPLQGIHLDGLAVVRATPLQLLSSADSEALKGVFPIANKDASLDFSSGAQISNEPVVALGGGKLFYFASEEELKRTNQRLEKLDELPGPHTGAQVIFLQASGAEGADSPTSGLNWQMLESSAELQASSWTETKKTVFFIRVDFSDNTGESTSQAALEQVLDLAVSDSIRDMSYGKTWIEADVSSMVVRMPSPSTSYLPSNNNALHTDAKTAFNALNSGINLNDYDIIGVHFKNIGMSGSGIVYAGLAGGGRQWLQGTLSSNVIIHEFGHNYGLGHARFWDTGGASVVGAGTTEEYGNGFDIMGSGPDPEGHFHPQAKKKIAWLDSADWVDASASGSATHRLYRSDHKDTSGVRGLRVDKNGSNDYYWLGYRRAITSNGYLQAGVVLNWEKSGTSWLVDTTPGSADGKSDSGISMGRTYSDPSAGVHITPIAQGGSSPNEWIDVTVNLGAFSGNASPVGSISGPATTTARQVELFSASATDADGDTLSYSWDMGDGVIQENSSSITHSWTVGGTYNISVTVSDMKGGSVTLNKSVNVTDTLTTWNERTSGTTNNLYAIASNSTHVVATGNDGVILRSADGSSWSDVSPSGFIRNIKFNDVIWTGAEFIAVGTDYDFADNVNGWESVIYTSANGQSWTRAYESNEAGTELNGIAYDGSTTLVAVGENATILRKVGAGGWSSITSTILGSHILQDVAYGAGSFVLVGHATTPSYNGDVEVRSSTDGASWTDNSANTGLSSWQDFREIEYTEGAFHASGFYGRARRSTDAGQTWSTTQNDDRYQIDGIASVSGVYYAVGHNNDEGSIDTDLISSDGISWVASVPGALPDRNELGTFKGTFISVGDSGSIRQSGSVTESTDFGSYTATYFPEGGGDAEATANIDNDWANNFMEYALGGNPTDGSSKPSPPTLSLDASGFPVFEVTRSSKKSDVAYSIWWSTDLTNWTQAGLTLEVDNETTLRVRGTQSAGITEKAFFMLQLSQ